MILIFQKNFYKLFNREIFHIHFIPLQFFIYHFCCYIIFTRYRIIRIQTKVLLIDFLNLYFRCIQSKKYPHPKLDYNINFTLAVRRKQIYHRENKIGRVFDFRTGGEMVTKVTKKSNGNPVHDRFAPQHFWRWRKKAKGARRWSMKKGGK